MRTVIIGGSGHVGTYLVPELVRAGHEVINVARGSSRPYLNDRTWDEVQSIIADRNSEEKNNEFGKRISKLKPDVVIDMICFKLESARKLVESLEGQVQHFLSCGTIWVHGYSVHVPATEAEPRRPFGQYGIQKAAIEAVPLKRFANR
ncbi:NAD-dependent epimerase/dehydratase family protein [Ferviditalea candida]|uniref:NAD-dependent epimerase/dehydratase family protein n=1 Tax=Ferviditalea candida TaxID=3108399 RepID=A0ABU5ZM74_9BACL|nr:NAD-dependent epimerase/dehydratase family protein [Paenibacillaceae bacterium T2]